MKEVVLSEIPESYMKKRISSGVNGICYLTEDNRLFKRFRYQIDYYTMLKQIINNYACNHLALPEELIFVNDTDQSNLIGYTREYIIGQKFSKLDSELELTKFVNALCKLEREMIDNTRNGLVYFDMGKNNLFYTPNDEIKAIDTELYGISYEDSLLYRVRENFKDLASTVIPAVYGEYDTDIQSIDEMILNLFDSSHRIILLSDVIGYSINELEKMSRDKINTLDDLKRELKLVREK